MAQPYPKTFPGYNFPTIPANDNRIGGFPYVGKPANDNRLPGKSMVPSIGSGLRRMRVSEARLRLILEGMSLVFDLLQGQQWGDVMPAEIPGVPEGIDLTGWTMVNNFGRAPHFNVAGQSTQGTAAPYSWPNVTKDTLFNYNFALAGFGGTQVPEFFVAPLPNANHFNFWHSYSPAIQSGYWRVGSSQRWARNVGNTNPVPQWHPAQDPVPQYVPIPVVRSKPMWRVRIDSRIQESIHGDPLRGPVTRTVPVPRPDTRPKPPGPDVKETKWHGKIRAILATIAEGITEVQDFVDCLYDALPLDLRLKLGLRRGYADLELKMDALYRYWGQLDAGKALTNLVYNGMEDAIAGRVYGAISRARSNLGVVTGPVVHGVRVTI